MSAKHSADIYFESPLVHSEISLLGKGYIPPHSNHTQLQEDYPVGTSLAQTVKSFMAVSEISQPELVEDSFIPETKPTINSSFQNSQTVYDSTGLTKFVVKDVPQGNKLQDSDLNQYKTAEDAYLLLKEVSEKPSSYIEESNKYPRSLHKLINKIKPTRHKHWIGLYI